MKITHFVVNLILLLHFVQTCEGDKPNTVIRNAKKLQGRELRVVMANFPPIIFFSRNESGHVTGYSGFSYQQLLWLSAKLKFTYKLFPASENTNGIKRNGTWNGVIGTISRGEADLAVVPIALSLERYEVIEFCGLSGWDWTGILVQYPLASQSLSSIFDVYSGTVWIGFFLSAVAIAGTWKILTRGSKKLLGLGIRIKRRDMSVGRVIWFLLRIVASQGDYFPSNRRTLQVILAGTWCLVAFVFVNIYNSTLMSYMSLTYQKPEINSFQDLANNPSIKPVVLIGSIQEMGLLGSHEKMKMIGDKIRKCAGCRKWDHDSIVIEVLENQHFVAVLPFNTGRSFIQKYSSERGKCRLTMAQERTSWQHVFFGVPKSSSYIEEINLESLWFFSSGLRDYWRNRMEKFPKQCELRYRKNGLSTKSSNNQLKLEQFYLSFLILLGGYLLAFIQFCRERLYSPTLIIG